MKNKLAIFALSAIMALSGTVAIASTNKNVKAAEDIPYGEYFTYDDSVVTMQANKSAPSYYPTGLTDVNNNKIVDNVGMGITTTKDTIAAIEIYGKLFCRNRLNLLTITFERISYSSTFEA